MHLFLQKVKEPELNIFLCVIIRSFLEISENYFLVDYETLVGLLLEKNTFYLVFTLGRMPKETEWIN